MTIEAIFEMCDQVHAINDAMRADNMQGVYAAATALQRLAAENGAWTPEKEAQAARIAAVVNVWAERQP